ncbi:MAG: hypothetical protein JNL67_19100 [Planctomycetaceae bacterium]|nr:hypothetical protein [Planctomycetaceae bacterium]
MKRDWIRSLATTTFVGAMGLVPAVRAMGQEEVVQENVQQSASIVISADPASGAQEGIVVMSAESVDGEALPVFGGFSFNSVDGNFMSFDSGDMGGGFFGGPEGPGGPTAFRFGAGLPMMGAANNWSSLLNIPEVRKELDVMDDQMKQINQARTDMEKRIKEEVSKMMEGGFDPSKAKEMAEVVRAQRAEIEQQISEQLLPAQVQRLKEIALRMQMKQVGTVGMLGRKDIKEALGLSDEQVKALETKAQELDKEMKKRIEELKKKAQTELLNELNPDQRKKLEEMLGKEFDYQASERPPVIRRTISGRGGSEGSGESKDGTNNRFELRSGGR